MATTYTSSLSDSVATYNCGCEKWYDIPEFEGLYQMSNHFRLKSLSRRINCGYGKTRVINERILTINYCDRYPTISLWRNNKGVTTRIHVIIAKVFIPNPENKPEVNHKNGDKLNFSIDNLEWNTKSENMQHAFDTGLHKPHGLAGELNPKSKLTTIHVLTIRQLWETDKYTKGRLAEIFSVDRSTIGGIINKKIWKHVA